MVHEIENGRDIGEPDAVQEDHGLRVRVLLQHLPEQVQGTLGLAVAFTKIKRVFPLGQHYT